ACLLGEVWDGARAKEVGLVAEVLEGDALVDRALSLARRLDDQEPAFARRLTDSVRRALVTPTHAEALAHETEAQQWSTTRPAFKDGVAAIEAQVSRAKKPGGEGPPK
ncbi:MAG TPA: enoyl-CoA hydratase-related protein, partial [Polyangiaceae bacterium]|nr:enoyl-CoA hydratase-related protein [Polyangiaceae bacterium]